MSKELPNWIMDMERKLENRNNRMNWKEDTRALRFITV